MRAWWVLGAIVVLALALRLWHLDHGLPYAYNADEELHFVPVAVKMFGGSLNPRYFENPPALTYLLFLVFKLRFGFGRDLIAQFRADPEAAYLTARVVVALIGTLVVGLVYWAGARFSDRRAGLAAAALMAVAFLPVFYSKHALNDVVTMAPVTVALVACLLVYEQGRWGHWVLAGAAIGVAIATKYTAGRDARHAGRRRRPAGPRATALSCGARCSAWSPRARPAPSRSRCSTRSRSSSTRPRWARSAASRARPPAASSARTRSPAGGTTCARSPGASAGCPPWPPWPAAG